MMFVMTYDEMMIFYFLIWGFHHSFLYSRLGGGVHLYSNLKGALSIDAELQVHSSIVTYCLPISLKSNRTCSDG